MGPTARTRKRLQDSVDARWARLCSNDDDVVMQTLIEAFPYNGTQAAPFGLNGAELSLGRARPLTGRDYPTGSLVTPCG